MSDSTRARGALPMVQTILASRVVRRFARSNAGAIAAGCAIFLILGDFLTGVEIAFTLLYLIPVAVAAWWRRRAFGLAIATACVCGATACEVVTRIDRGWSLPVWRMAWNYGGSLVIFGLFVELVVRLRAYVDRDERARRTAVEQLRQAERLGVVGKLAAGVAHELGTPLNVIVGHAELLDSDRATRPSLHASSTTILAQVEKMTTIIRGLLDFSRRAGGERLPVDLDTLTQDAAALLQPLAHKKEIEVEVEVAAKRGRNVVVQGNRTELEQVLVNLMLNGIQAMSAGGTLHVRVRTPRVHDADQHGSTPPPSSACVEIEDEGVGISPESLPQIFDPFFTTKGVGEGTGLGLSVSYGIVSDHGGRIQVSSVLGSGSRFSVYLPLAEASS